MSNADDKNIEALMDALFGHLLGMQVHPDKEAQAREALIRSGVAVIPFLVERLSHPNFWAKKRAYDLLIELGLAGSIKATDLPHQPQPIVRLWLYGVLRFWNATRPEMHLTGMLSSQQTDILSFLSLPDTYVRHLSTLSLTFLGDIQGNLIFQVAPILIEALDDNSEIEGSDFTIAGAALNCLSDLSGRKFFTNQADVIYFNFQEMVSPPPIVPFPLTGDQMTTVPDDMRRAIKAAVEQWWKQAASGGADQFRSLPNPYSI